jgi:hypothetical protein
MQINSKYEKFIAIIIINKLTILFLFNDFYSVTGDQLIMRMRRRISCSSSPEELPWPLAWLSRSSSSTVHWRRWCSSTAPKSNLASTVHLLCRGAPTTAHPRSHVAARHPLTGFCRDPRLHPRGGEDADVCSLGWKCGEDGTPVGLIHREIAADAPLPSGVLMSEEEADLPLCRWQTLLWRAGVGTRFSGRFTGEF